MPDDLNQTVGLSRGLRTTELRVSHLTAANLRSWRHHVQSQRVLGPKINVRGATDVALHSHPINVHDVLFGIGENGLLPDHSLDLVS
jgi:hypothetical protein